jgi:peptide/nickel transport system substrate-binding protein
MTRKSFRVSALVLVSVILFLVTVGGTTSAEGPKSGGIVRAAMIGEPPTLDYGISTANLTGTIAQHIFETLLAFDEENIPQPLLAQTYTVSDDGLLMSFELRKGVLFHNGKEMTSEDVVSSLNRWTRLSPRGKIASDYISAITPTGEYSLNISLNKPFSPLSAFLALDNAAAGIFPKEVVERAGDKPLTEYIGTGPYALVEWIPDRYIRLKRFDKYSPDSRPASGNAGRRIAYIDEIRYYPVPDATARLAGLASGEYDYAEALSYDAYPSIKENQRLVPIVVRPFLAPVIFFNCSEGIMSNPLMRQALAAALNMEEIMVAAYSDPAFYELGPSFFDMRTVLGSLSGSDVYDQRDSTKAKELLAAAGYQNQPIRWLATKEYDYIYNVSTIAASQLKKVGFNIDLQIYDWATLVDRRARPEMWDVFVTGHGFVPDPSLLTFMSPTYPGGWKSEDKDRLFEKYCAVADPNKRAEVWSDIQRVVWDELPVVRLGDGFGLGCVSSRLKNVEGRLQIFLWNAWLDQ